MKKQLLPFLFLLSSISIFSQCNYSFVLTDSGNNGWNSNTMVVRQNGVTVRTLGMPTGSGPTIANAVLTSNVAFELFWNSGGTLPNEVGVSILDPSGQLIYTKPATAVQNSLLYSGLANCTTSSCAPVTGVSASSITQTSASINWSSSGATQWEVLVLPQGTLPTSNQTGVTTTIKPFVVTGLTCNTAYSVYVRKVCTATDLSPWAGAANFTPGPCPPSGTATCQGANSLCGAFGTVFPNTTNVTSQGTMGCVSTTPNATWFSFSTNTAGLVNLEIKQGTLMDMSLTNLDADYIIYGPYPQSADACNQLTADKIVACSYSTAAVELPSFTAVADQDYYLMVTNFSNNAGFIKISELPTTTASLECSGFRLNAFLDSNTNGVKDASEQNFPQGKFIYEKNNDGSIHNVISSTGVLNIYDSVVANSYDFAYQLNSEYNSYYALSTSAYNDVSITAAGQTTLNFPVVSTASYNDLGVSLVPMEEPRPGFSYRNKIIYTNNGNQIIANGTISFAKDAALSITNISQSGTISDANGFTYNFSNLSPFETRIIEVTMQVPTIPTVQLGHLLSNSATAAILAGGDVIAENNSFVLTETIVGSYDPNDITEAHGEQIVFAEFGSDEYLYYTIRFENTGTASAINVRINDVLDVKLDETTIKMITASHNYIMDRVGTTVNWDFKNIGLPTTSQNPNTSKGYVIYKIKPKPGYAIGDIIPNTANIFFDYNPAIVTNTFNTQFVAQLAVSEFLNNSFLVYPNPAKEMVTVAMKGNQDAISAVTLYDISGKIIFSKTFSSPTIAETIDVSHLSKGLYLIEVTTDSNLRTFSKIVVE